MTADQTAELAATPLAGLLRSTMDRAGWSIRTLEDVSGVPRSTIGAILTGRHLSVPAETLRPLARALGLPWDEVEDAELASRAAVWELPARAQRLSPAGRRALVAYLDELLSLEQRHAPGS